MIVADVFFIVLPLNGWFCCWFFFFLSTINWRSDFSVNSVHCIRHIRSNTEQKMAKLYQSTNEWESKVEQTGKKWKSFTLIGHDLCQTHCNVKKYISTEWDVWCFVVLFTIMVYGNTTFCTHSSEPFESHSCIGRMRSTEELLTQHFGWCVCAFVWRPCYLSSCIHFDFCWFLQFCHCDDSKFIGLD